MFEMFGSSLFSVMYTRYTILLRKANSQIKKGTVGQVIKKLNKENKALFGELLETRPQKRKREARKGPAIASSAEQQSDSVHNQTSSEARWYRQTLPASYVVQLKRNSNTNSEVKSNKSDRPGEQSLKTSQKQHHVNSFVKSQSEASHYHTSLLSLENSVNEVSLNSNGDLCTSHVTNLETTDKKFPVLVLPDVIVRNIPTFPLMNESKNTEWMIPTESILNVPSSTEQVHNKKDYLLYPSVTKILNATMSDSSRAALKKWRQKMISELGEEGFLKYHRGMLELQNRLYLSRNVIKLLKAHTVHFEMLTIIL
jgi:hypothetical protein